MGCKTPPVKCTKLLVGVKVCLQQVVVTTCAPEFSFLMLLDHYYLFLPGGTNKHVICHELGTEINIDFEGGKRILER